VWLVDLGFAGKVRPALIVNTPVRDDERDLLAAVPHTTSTRGGRFEVLVAVRYLQTGAFDVQGLGHIKPTNLVRKLGVMGADDLQLVEAVIKQWLEL
jgi:mRNA interferase MazF